MAAARIRFLDAAANQLQHDAPAVAATLGSSCLSHLQSLANTSPGLLPKLISDVYCRACGSLLVPDKHSNHDFYSPGKHGHRSAHDAKSPLHVTCGRCHRRTRCTLHNSMPAGTASQNLINSVDRDAAVDAPRDALPPVQESAHARTTSPISKSVTPSKKRSRAKKSSGLAALLAKSQADANTRRNDGLDLADFLKRA